jgi:hypothetical protein
MPRPSAVSLPVSGYIFPLFENMFPVFENMFLVLENMFATSGLSFLKRKVWDVHPSRRPVFPS